MIRRKRINLNIYHLIILLLIISCQCGNSIITGELEKNLISIGLVNIHDVDSSIIVELMYSTENNFMKEDVYKDLTRCYLKKDVAHKLKKANDMLKNKHQNYRLIVYDCVRPRSIQWKMWDIVKDSSKKNYVAHPKYGSNHNYAAAVDLSIARMNGDKKNKFQILDMGTQVDHLGKLAEPRHEKKYLKQKILTAKQVENRLILRQVMLEAGFSMVPNEWWHFNACSTREIRKKYKIID